MREDNLVIMVKDLLRDADELKTAQFTGSNQIIGRKYSTSNTYDWQGTLNVPYQSEGSGWRMIKVVAKPPLDAYGNPILEKNMSLITDLITEVRTTPTGSQVHNWTAVNNNFSGIIFGSSKIDTGIGDPNSEVMNTYYFFISGSLNQQVYLKFFVISNTDIQITVTALN